MCVCVRVHSFIRIVGAYYINYPGYAYQTSNVLPCTLMCIYIWTYRETTKGDHEGVCSVGRTCTLKKYAQCNYYIGVHVLMMISVLHTLTVPPDSSSAALLTLVTPAAGHQSKPPKVRTCLYCVHYKHIRRCL